MNQRERLLAVFNGEAPDAVPWYGDLSYWYDGQERRGTLARRYRGDEGYLRLHEETGVGIYLYAPPLYRTSYASAIDYHETQDGEDRIFEYRTPGRTLVARQRWLAVSCSYAYVEHFVKCFDDLRTMELIFRNTRYEPDYAGFLRTDALWSQCGMAVALAPISVSAVQKLMARWAGVETTIALMAEDTDEFDRLVRSIQQAEDGVFRIMEDGPGALICFGENLSSEITGRNLYRRYLGPCYASRIAGLHRRGKNVMIHIDGTLKGLLPLLSETGFDAAEAVTPAPMGDVEVERLREVAGEDIVIWGGIPGALFSPLFPQKTFEAHVMRVLGAFPCGSRFVLGVADQVPPDAELSRIASVRDLVERYGSLPASAP